MVFLRNVFLFALTVFCSTSWSQTKTQNTFVSQVDQSLTVHTVLLVPVEDNLSGIYAKPIQEHLKESLAQDSQWTPSEFSNFSGQNLNSLYSNPKDVTRLAKAAQADAVLKVRMTKGPAGINGKLTLFSGRDGLPIVEESVDNYQRFEVGDVQKTFEQAVWNLRNRMPYRAEILSRRGQEITVNAGKNSGIKAGTDISVIQILKIFRHPKLNFIIATQKEILGKARVYKVDDTITFARLVMEREPGVVQVGAKILPDEYIQYSEPYITEEGQVLSEIGARKDKDVSYGEKPTEWLPDHGAQYGRFDATVGPTQYTENVGFSSGSTASGTNNLAPTLDLYGEFWISPAWFAGIELKSSAFSVSNDLSGSTPDKINMTLNFYHVAFGYNFLLSPDFFGPKLQVTGGFAKFNSHADSSTPLVFTNMEYGGAVIGFAGQFPLGESSPTDIGAKLNYYWSPSVTESSSTSGSSSDIKINDFGFFFNYHSKPKFSYIGELKFESYSSKFTGGGSRSPQVDSVSHKVTSMMFGVEFLF